MNETDERNFETALLNRNRLNEAVKLINDTFSETDYQIMDGVRNEDIEFTYYFLTNKNYAERTKEGTLVVKKHRRLSQLIFDFYYLKADGTKFYHYTKISALTGILKKELKLKPLITNQNFDEFKTFYKDHDLIGYTVNTDESGKLMEQVLMEQCFAICFASPHGLTNEKDKTLWYSFADNTNGVRIEWNIETNHTDFRKIFYRKDNFDKNKLLLNRLNKDTQSTFNRIFTVAGLSKIGAFYLPGFYNIENEVRFLMKQFTDDYEFTFDVGKGYIMLPFESEFGKFSISKIRIRNKDNVDTVSNLLSENGFDPNSLIEIAS
jgi:hypothetical protein